MSTRDDLRPILHAAAWVAVNLLGAIACLGAIVLVALAAAIVLELVPAAWDIFAWLCVAEVGLIVAAVTAAGELSRRHAPRGSWTTH